MYIKVLGGYYVFQLFVFDAQESFLQIWSITLLTIHEVNVIGELASFLRCNNSFNYLSLETEQSKGYILLKLHPTHSTQINSTQHTWCWKFILNKLILKVFFPALITMKGFQCILLFHVNVSQVIAGVNINPKEQTLSEWSI